MVKQIYMWYDKVDKTYLSDSIMVSDQRRSVCRGYIKAFENDRKMNPAEYELRCVGSVDLNSGEITSDVEVVDPRIVYSSDQSDYEVIAPPSLGK